MKLRSRILTFAVPLTLVPFVLAALAAYYFLILGYEVRADEQQNARLGEAIASIRKEREAAQRDIEMLASLPLTTEYLSAVEAGASPGQLESRAADLRAMLQLFGNRSAYCLELGVVDSQGRSRVSFSKLPGSQPLELPRNMDYFRRTLISGAFQSPVEEIRPDRFASVLTHRVRRDKFLGAIVLYLNADVFQTAMRPLLAAHGLNTFMFDDRGLVFARSFAGAEEESCLSQLDLAREADALLSLPTLEISQKDVSRGGRSFIFSVLPAEALVRSFIEPQSGENWFLGVIKQPDSSPGSGARFTVAFFAILLGAVVVVFWGTTWYARRVTVPLERVAKATSLIAQGQFDISLGIRTGDEVEELASAVGLMSEDLKKYREELLRSAKLAAMGEMASEISHEIQNRVSGVSLWIQHLDAELEKDDPRREYLDEMKQGLQGFNNLLADLKRVYRTPLLNLSEVNLNDVVTGSLPSVDQRIRERAIRAELRLDPGLPKVPADAEKLQSIILNLIVNSVEAVDNGGHIIVQTSLVSPAGSNRPTAVKVSVSDNGTGISEQDLSRVFHPFYSTKRGGSGLGLAIAWNIVSAHGGRIEVESGAGEGATFTVTLKT